jgi:hypothetical protein
LRGRPALDRDRVGRSGSVGGVAESVVAVTLAAKVVVDRRR